MEGIEKMVSTASSSATMLEDASIEMTGKDVPALIDASARIPAGSRINVTFLGNEDLPMRLDAAKAVLDRGFVPVPHISARRLTGHDQLVEFLAALQAQGTSENVFVVGGDPHTPAGPYASSLDVIRTGLLPEYGVRHVSVSGYPEGHPDIDDSELWNALTEKAAALAEYGLDGTIITQFGFDASAVLDWAAEVRDRGVALPIRVGVPGPAGVKRLLGFAGRFGVASSAGIVRKYGFSLTNLLGTAGPDRFIEDLAAGCREQTHGELKLHFYPFGGLGATSEWIQEFRASRG